LCPYKRKSEQTGTEEELIWQTQGEGSYLQTKERGTRSANTFILELLASRTVRNIVCCLGHLVGGVVTAALAD
jgi:hypothetical protein